MDDFLAGLGALAPTVLVGLVFWLVMFVILRADKHERRAFSKIEAEERAKLAASNAASEDARVDAAPPRI
ncbi:hypothetical protein [Agreia bicolorata]|uniref:Lysyl-tRNA synthetase n=1 Tax=Agreia bicolorata TaxID=110935 RepID=A0ABR5CHJ0_9MICO|nr:hypothetical protein [Agreia bicolorata]KJC65031.1 hypothetical protein TZ00_05485 [Agreia bicolorata]